MTDQILLYAAGALSEHEAEEVRRYLASGSPRAAGLLAEAEATVALLPLMLHPHHPPASLRERLMARVLAHGASAHGAPVHTPTEARGGAGPAPWWMLVAIPSAIAAAVAAGITIFFALRMEPGQPLQPTVPAVAAVDLEKTIGVLTQAVERDEHELAALRSSAPGALAEWATEPHLKLVSLSCTANQPGAEGRVFWDTDRGVWHFFARGMKPAEEGKTYELWFVSSDQKTAIPAGEFNPTAEGDASLVTQVPPSIAPRLTIAAVTDEPEGKTITAPTGSFQLMGSLP